MNKTVKIVITVLLIAASVVSCVFVARKTSSSDTYTGVIGSIDQKKEDVLKLTAATTATTVAISMLPSDWGDPVANEIADFADYFLLILGVLFTEKFLLTIFGSISCRVLIPLACLIFIFGIWKGSRTAGRLGAKVFALGLALVLIIPLSMKASDMVDDVYQNTINETVSSVETFEDSAEQSSGLSIVTGELDRLKEMAEDTINSFLESIAVLIVTSCVIPILGVLFIVWLFKRVIDTAYTLSEKTEEKEYSMQ